MSPRPPTPRQAAKRYQSKLRARARPAPDPGPDAKAEAARRYQAELEARGQLRIPGT